MSEAYRAGSSQPRTPAAERTAAYLVTRMPATYAAARSVLRETRRLLGGRAIASVLDIGAGSGAASLAALEEYPDAAVTLVDRDCALLEAAREWLPRARSISQDAARAAKWDAHDLVLLAYSASEMAAAPLERLWKAARVAMILIEAGTPRGFAVIRSARSELLAAGAHMIAPCPSEGACPIVDPDWCHFAARVERSSLHRQIKGADLGYEDEKYSYVALAREPVTPAAARIVGRPRHHPGLIELDTCTPEGLTTVRASKRDRDRFRAARHAEWGAPGI
jgi:ribosomal protein RSM22 (predicted rRNA methylase)